MVQLPAGSGWIAVTFDRESVVASVTQSAREVVGISGSELAGRPVTDILEDATVFKLPGMMEQAVREGLWRGEVRHRAAGGQTRAGSGVLVPVSLAGAPGAGFLLVITSGGGIPLDDSLHYEAGSRIRRFCHDLNNPLAVMLGFVQLAMLSPQCEGKMQADMEKLYSELKRAIDVAQRLHQYGVELQEHGDKEPDR